MSPTDWLPFLTELADGADQLALRWFRAAGLRVQQKPDLSPVTEADQAIEAMARKRVRQAHPELGVLGEEEGEAAAHFATGGASGCRGSRRSSAPCCSMVTSGPVRQGRRVGSPG